MGVPSPVEAKEQVTVLLTTHYLEEADFLCDRVAIIDKGKIVVVGKPGDLKQTLNGEMIRVNVRNITPGISRELKKISGLGKIEVNGNEVSMVANDAETKIVRVISAIKSAKADIESISIHKPTLEDVFLHYTGRGMQE